jgi:polyribonucleotide nucleotidyltransferase
VGYCYLINLRNTLLFNIAMIVYCHQVTANVLSSDGKHDPDVMAANATSAALMLSDIPWNGPIAVIRVGRIDGKFVFNPTMDELSLSNLNLVYACTKDKTLMIDVQAREITERDLQAGLRLAHREVIFSIFLLFSFFQWHDLFSLP